MKRRTNIGGAALAVAAAAAVVLSRPGLSGAQSPGRTGPDSAASYAIFPRQQIGLRFDHRVHVGDLGMRCTVCHDAARSERSGDRLIPAEAVCRHCHGIDRGRPELQAYPPARCDTCHEGFDVARPAFAAGMDVPAPNLRFPHGVHVRRGIECVNCHGDVGALRVATRAQLPTMGTCLTCHNDTAAPAACSTCHLTQPDGILRVAFDTGTLSPPEWMRNAEHGPDWIERHRWIAGNDSAFCSNCHRESECTDCHDGRLRNRHVHPNDWLTMHPVAAWRNTPDCASCHREQSFCIGCHRRAGVADTSPTAVRFRGGFHPPPSIWTDLPRTPAHHAYEAQRNIQACVSCHSEQDCVRCHGSRGAVFGGADRTVHPPSFFRDCQRLLRANARPCSVCHDLLLVGNAATCR